MRITSLRHPEYSEMETEWEKYRLTYAGGRPFIDEYLQRFSKREDVVEFASRKKSSYCPAHAKTAVNEIKDAISERLVDVVRIGGSETYQTATEGIDGGVDHFGSTMNGFISCNVLAELLSMGKAGVYIDRAPLEAGSSKVEVLSKAPYLYSYRAEDILNWNYNEQNILTDLLLRENVFDYDKESGLPKGTKERYRRLQLQDGVIVTLYDAVGKETEVTKLDLISIPFALFEIGQSLMTDIADYQIALLNLGSSDLSYAIKANFPFYTEQYDFRDFATNLLSAGDVEISGTTQTPGTSEEANSAKTKEAKVGPTQGRRYPKGTDRPGFIHPSSEPLKASMDKQSRLQDEVRELVRLSVKSLASSSSDSKQEDRRSVESGLSCIGAELEKGERQIATVWADYEKTEVAIIKYPDNYTLRTENERRTEANELLAIMPKLPSSALKKQIASQVATILVGHRATREQMDDIITEIETAEVIVTDPEVIRADQEAGLVGNELASRLRGYPSGEVEKAKIDHTERLARIAKAQSENSVANLNAARGVKDMDTGESSASEEKKESRDTTKDDVVTDKTRGASNG